MLEIFFSALHPVLCVALFVPADALPSRAELLPGRRFAEIVRWGMEIKK
ncbi:MAG: hypothetical protein IKZ67_04505 [Paludibacteraceae bacterium]|nr:hypothetical protein [Paludibacteraceae bacterium]